MGLFSFNAVKQLQGSAANEFNWSSHLFYNQAMNLLSLEVIRSIIIYLITHVSHLIWTVEHSLTIWGNTLFRRSMRSERSMTPSSRLIQIQKMTLSLLLSRLIHFQKMTLSLLLSRLIHFQKMTLRLLLSRMTHFQKMTLRLLLSRMIQFQKMTLRLLFLMRLCHHSLHLWCYQFEMLNSLSRTQPLNPALLTLCHPHWLANVRISSQFSQKSSTIHCSPDLFPTFGKKL